MVRSATAGFDEHRSSRAGISLGESPLPEGIISIAEPPHEVTPTVMQFIFMTP
jgi:hypothetical protein